MRNRHLRRARRGTAAAGIALASSLLLASCTGIVPSAGPGADSSTLPTSEPSATGSPTPSGTPSPSSSPATTPDAWPEFTDKDTQVTFRLPSRPEGYTFTGFNGTDFRQTGATYLAAFPLDAQSISVELTVTVYRATGHQCLDGRTELESLQHGWMKDGFKEVSLTDVHARKSGGRSLTTGLILRDDPVLGHWSETFLVQIDKGGVGILVGGGADTTESGWTADQLSAIQQLVTSTVEQIGFPSSVQDSTCGSFNNGKGTSGAGTST